MNLEELERLAREAHRDEDLSWWHEHSLRYHLRVLDGTCPESDPPFIAACSPETVLRLVSIAKAAVREPTTEEIELALERHCLKSTSISRADMRWVLAGFVADRAALIPRGANLVKGESE